jgi:hypothetical protein
MGLKWYSETVKTVSAILLFFLVNTFPGFAWNFLEKQQVSTCRSYNRV